MAGRGHERGSLRARKCETQDEAAVVRFLPRSCLGEEPGEAQGGLRSPPPGSQETGHDSFSGCGICAAFPTKTVAPCVAGPSTLQSTFGAHHLPTTTVQGPDQKQLSPGNRRLSLGTARTLEPLPSDTPAFNIST
eukprot:11546317-Alexandrium_andersonii.AAC.1